MAGVNEVGRWVVLILALGTFAFFAQGTTALSQAGSTGAQSERPRSRFLAARKLRSLSTDLNVLARMRQHVREVRVSGRRFLLIQRSMEFA